MKRASGQREPDIQQTPPHDDNAEKAVLSSIMLFQDKAISQCVEAGVRSEWFFVPAHQTIFQDLLDVYDANGKLELIGYTEHLRARGLLAAIGGAAAITDIALFVDKLHNYAPTIADLPDRIELLRNAYMRREIIAGSALAARRAYDPEPDADMGAVLDEVTSRIDSLRSLGRNGAHRFTMRSPDEILALPRDPHANYLADRILAKGQSLLVAGIGDLGKTRLLLQLLASFILGRSWCGLEVHTKGIKCNLLQAENINHRLQDDLDAIKRLAGKDWKLIERNLRIHTLETDRDLLVGLGDPENVRHWQAIIRHDDPAIVAFDSVYNFGIGDLNADADMAATCLTMSRIAHIGNSQRSLIAVHHALTGREGAKKAFGFERSGFARNSKVIFQFFRAQINIAPGNEDYSVLLLFCGKNNNGKRFPDLAVRLPESMIYQPEPDFDIEGWKEQISAPKKTKGQTQLQRLRERLEKERKREFSGPQLVAIIKEVCNVERARAYKILDQAVTQRLLRFNKQTEIYAFA
jgi:hypothetical protein